MIDVFECLRYVDESPSAAPEIEATAIQPSASSRAVWVHQNVTEYLNQHTLRSKAPSTEARRLFNKYVIPAFGDQFLSGVGTEDWIRIIENAALCDHTESQHLLAETKKLLTWVKNNKRLKRNPLAGVTAKSLSIHQPWYVEATFLQLGDLCKIYHAAAQLDQPWTNIVRAAC